MSPGSWYVNNKVLQPVFKAIFLDSLFELWIKACLAFQCQCTKSHKLLSSALVLQCMFRMCHTGMTKQEQASNSKLIAITNTQNRGLPQTMVIRKMMVVFSGINCVLYSLATVFNTWPGCVYYPAAFWADVLDINACNWWQLITTIAGQHFTYFTDN